MKDCLKILKERAQTASLFIASQFEKEDIYTNPKAMNELKKAMLLVKNLHALILQIEKSILNEAKCKMQLEALSLKIEKIKTSKNIIQEQSMEKESFKSNTSIESKNSNLNTNIKTKEGNHLIAIHTAKIFEEFKNTKELYANGKLKKKEQSINFNNNWHALNQNVGSRSIKI